MFSDDDEAYCFSHHDYMYDTDDSEPYFDDDDYYDDYDDEFVFNIRTSRMVDKIAQLRATEEVESDDGIPAIFQPKSLVDNCCKYLALNFPFAYLQDRFPPVPDDLQLKIITFSFPENEDQITKYAKFSRPSVDLGLPKAMCKSGNVTNMMQIGFRLSASVDKQYVTIHFDRGKITSAQCSCGDSSGWCFHVLATALQRIKQTGKLDKSQLRLPVSDALNTLSREQLLKFSQYLLYHHQNHKVVETAQDLIDKLVNHHGDYGNEDINIVQGAPDPTAGPGLDEESHWFMCDEGFKDKCKYIIHESLYTLGFVCQENASKRFVCQENAGGKYYLRELWYKNRCNPPLVKDEVDIALGGEFVDSSSRHQPDPCNLLETILELLRDDSTSGLMAIKSFTEQVVSHLKRRTLQFKRLSDAQNQLSFPTVSPAMGFTARPFRSWTLCDELSRLWQVAVLNPKLKAKEREQVAQELLTWNQEVQTGCSFDPPWKGLEIAYNLCQHINWNESAMQDVIHGHIPAHFSISGIALVVVKLQQDHIVQCHLPYCLTYGSITLDILTWCAMIHTLEMLNFQTIAVNIAFCLSVALIALYRHNADSRLQISGIPILRRWSFDYNVSKNKADRGTTDEGKESINELEWDECWCPLIWPSDVLVSLRSFAFLHNVLWLNKSKVEPLIATLKQHDSLGTTKVNGILYNISDTESLVFQVGVIGLLLPKFPMSTMKQEVELYDLENWLTFKLLDVKAPSSNDLEFLSYLCQTVKKEGPHWLLAPCSSFTRVILHHTYKGLSCLSNDVLELVFQNLEFAFIQDTKACPQNLFEFSIAVSWCKLAELSLSIFVVNNPSFVERTTNCLFNKNGMLGEGLLKLQISFGEVENRHLLQVALRVKSWLCFALAKALFARIKRSSKSTDDPSGHKCLSITEFLTGITNRTLDIFPLITSPSDIMSLKKCAIRLGAQSAFLQTSDHFSSDGSALRWLIETSIECGLWGVRCLLSSHDEVSDFLPHGEAMTLCKWLLKKKDACRVSLVKEVLLSMLRQAVNTKAVSKVKDILLICREGNKNACHFLIPWVCEHLRDMVHTKTVHYEVLMFGSEEVFRCYKERLTQTIIENQRLSNPDDNYGLRQLFAEESEEELEEQYTPCPLPNPYMTSLPHPFIELSFDLGMMGLNALTSVKNAQLRRCHNPNETLRKGHLIQLCDLVCYITNRKWLHQTSDECKDMPCLSGSLCDIDGSYLTRLVNDLLKLNVNTMMLMTILCEITRKLQGTKSEDILAQIDDNPNLKRELLQNVVQKVPHLQPLLERIESSFQILLLGSKMNGIVKKIMSQRSRSSSKDLRVDLEYSKLEDSTLRETLIAAKVVHEVNDPSGATFKKLADEIEKEHNCKELKAVLDGIMSGEKAPCPRDSGVLMDPFFLLPFITQERFRRRTLEDFEDFF